MPDPTSTVLKVLPTRDMGPASERDELTRLSKASLLPRVVPELLSCCVESCGTSYHSAVWRVSQSVVSTLDSDHGTESTKPVASKIQTYSSAPPCSLKRSKTSILRPPETSESWYRASWIFSNANDAFLAASFSTLRCISTFCRIEATHAVAFFQIIVFVFVAIVCRVRGDYKQTGASRSDLPSPLLQ